MAKLVCQAGPDAGHEYRLTKDVSTMGRSSSTDVPIKDTMASRNHCQVRREGRLYILVDLGSRNGTKLNEKKISERQLAFGDHIRVGECEWLLVKEAGDIELKDLLSKYDLQEKIGEGGMGVVYKAVQRSMARTVALKILSPKYAAKKKYVEQFIKEARAAGQFNHPNIIQVHDVATENEIHYFSMEFVDGPTCMQLLKANGAFPVPEALEIARQTAKALEYAHEHRLIHQDIKPDNIMVGSNNLVKVADLGISKTFDEVESEEGPKRVMGTPHYMAPEAALGKRIDHRVDLYSLGTTMYHMLAGKTPYTGTSATEVLKAQVMDPMPAIQDISPDVPDGVCALVERLMAKKPDDRYQSATEVAEEIKRLQAGLDLGKDRIPGAETMILQRLARGEPGGPGNHTPNETPTARSTGVAVPPNVEARRLRQVFILGVVAVILFLVILLLPRFLPKSATTDADEPNSSGTVPIPTVPADPQTAAPDVTVQVTRRLDAVEGTLNGNDEVPLDDVQAEVERILGEQPTNAQRLRGERLQSRVTAAIAKRDTTQQEQAWTNLHNEVGRLVSEKNYDLALKRIGAFPHRDLPRYQDQIGALRDQTTRERDRFATDLKERLASYVARKDVVRLRDLRDSLPKALLGTPIEKQIADEITKVELEMAQRQQLVLREIAEEMLRFDAAKVEERHRLTRSTISDPTLAQAADDLLAGAKGLPALITALDTAIRTSDARKVRFIGELQRMRNPELVGATRSGLVLQAPVGSGEIEVSWRNVAAAALGAVVEQVLGSAGIHQPVLDALAKAGTLVAQ